MPPIFTFEMICLMILALLVFALVVALMVSPKARRKYLEFFPSVRGRNGKPFTEKETVGLLVLAGLIVVVLMI